MDDATRARAEGSAGQASTASTTSLRDPFSAQPTLPRRATQYSVADSYFFVELRSRLGERQAVAWLLENRLRNSRGELALESMTVSRSVLDKKKRVRKVSLRSTPVMPAICQHRVQSLLPKTIRSILHIR